MTTASQIEIEIFPEASGLGSAQLATTAGQIEIEQFLEVSGLTLCAVRDHSKSKRPFFITAKEEERRWPPS